MLPTLRPGRASHWDIFFRQVLSSPETSWTLSDPNPTEEWLATCLDSAGMHRGLWTDKEFVSSIRSKCLWPDADNDFFLLMAHQARMTRLLLGDRLEPQDLLIRHLVILAHAYGLDALPTHTPKTDDATLLDCTKLIAKGLAPERARQRDPLFSRTLRPALNYARTMLVGRLASIMRAKEAVDRSTLWRAYYDFLAEARALVFALIGLMWADSELQKSESRFIKELVSVMRFDKLDKQELLTALEDGTQDRSWITQVRSQAARRFIMEQTALAALMDGKTASEEERYLEALASDLGFSPQEVETFQLNAMQFYNANASSLSTGFQGRLSRFKKRFSSRVSQVVKDNLSRLMEEVRQTGELSALLAQAARRKLTPEERLKVRAQLLDICRTVPALAIFALPGGGVLLPILIKALPIQILPSAFED